MTSWLKKLGNRNRYWGDWNYRFGPFTLSETHYGFCAVLVGYNPEGEDEDSHIRLGLFGKMLIIEMPNWINSKPVEIFENYTENHTQEFGVTYSSELGLRLAWGIKSNFIKFPWKDQHYESEEYLHLLYKGSEKRYFYFSSIDCDNEKIYGRILCKNMTYAKGPNKGFWKFLNYFKKHYYGIDVEFNTYVGDRKNTWKGGIKFAYLSLKSKPITEFCFLSELTKFLHSNGISPPVRMYKGWQPELDKVNFDD